MAALNKYVNNIVSINNPNESEKGFGIVKSVDPRKNTLFIDMYNEGLYVDLLEIDRDRVNIEPSKNEVIIKLKSIISDFYSRVDKCANKECTVCPQHKDKYDQALNLIELLKIL